MSSSPTPLLVKIKLRHLLGAGTAGVGLACMLFLCLRPSSEFATLGLPNNALIAWLDQHGELRNLPAFAALTIPFMVGARKASRRRWAVLGLLVISAAVEGAQIFIPSRVPSVMDIVWSWVGIVFVWLTADAIWTKVESQLRKKTVVRRSSPKRVRTSKPAVATVVPAVQRS